MKNTIHQIHKSCESIGETKRFSCSLGYAFFPTICTPERDKHLRNNIVKHIILSLRDMVQLGYFNNVNL